MKPRKSRRPKTRRPKLKRRKTRKRGGMCEDINQRAHDYMMSYPHPK